MEKNTKGYKDMILLKRKRNIKHQRTKDINITKQNNPNHQHRCKGKPFEGPCVSHYIEAKHLKYTARRFP